MRGQELSAGHSKRRKYLKADKLWEEFCRATGTDEACEYEAWAFGDAPDKLADLVLRSIKTATASAYDLYAADGEPLPKVGEYSVILNSREDAVCVIRTTRLEVLPFCKVDERHAYLEGETGVSPIGARFTRTSTAASAKNTTVLSLTKILMFSVKNSSVFTVRRTSKTE